MSILPSPAPGLDPREDFSALDRVFGDFLCRTAKSQDPSLRLLGMKLIRARREGHSFLFLSPAEQDLLAKFPCLTDEKNGLLMPEDDKLYLLREFRNEERAAQIIAGLLKKPLRSADFSDEEIDDACGTKLNGEQHQAVRNALARSFALISGGPGTGKSTVIAAVAELELRADPQRVISIAAPTGKAAELLTANLSRTLPERKLQAQTLHRLFGQNPETGKFRRNEENPLECDLLIVDECSMVPLNLAANMLRGLRPDARVVLVGDHRQLESIESGNVLGELLSARQDPASPLGAASVELLTNYRSAKAPRIQQLAAEIRKEILSPEELLGLLSSGSGDCRFLAAASDSLMLETARKYWSALPVLAADRKNQAEVFERFKKFRILTANRAGPGGCDEINTRIMKELGLRSRYAPGSALMVTRNS